MSQKIRAIAPYQNISQANADRRSFQYAGHHRSDYEYSPFHEQLDYALRHFYGKGNLATVLMKKGLLTFNEMHLLDHATVDVWPNVVWVKIPSYYPSSHALIFHKSEKSFCRFISKKDFLEAVIDYAQLQGNQHTALACQDDPQKMSVKSAATRREVYELTPRPDQCKCTCKATAGLMKAFTEDPKMQRLLVADPIMQGQIPDKHVFSVWRSFGATDFRHYQYKQREWFLAAFGLSLDYIIPGHYTVYQGNRKLGTVDRKYDEAGNEYWTNQRQVTMLRTCPGDRLTHATAEAAAIALAQLLKVISDGEKAKADLFGDEPEPQSQHLIESHGDFIDDFKSQEEDLRLAADFEAEEQYKDEPEQSLDFQWLTVKSFQ